MIAGSILSLQEDVTDPVVTQPVCCPRGREVSRLQPGSVDSNALWPAGGAALQGTALPS